MAILTAVTEDVPDLVTLMNNAYRGDISKKGWTTEANLLKGDLRTDEATLYKLINLPGARLLKFVNKKKEIQGSIFLQKKENRLYLGMLSVSPLVQAKGIGKQLMAAAEIFASEQACDSIFMKVISIRHELIAWYERQGYSNSGKTEPFPVDTRFGIPTQPLEFIILEKTI